MNPKVDKYLIDGCMRCKLGATPKCKVKNWQVELETLRYIVLKTGVIEEVKWGVPCYTYNNKNIVMISAFKEYTCLSFFKGALLKDKEKILVKQGEHSQAVRIIKYTNAAQIIEQSDFINTYISELIDLEKSGQKLEFKKTPEPVPYELTVVFTNDPELKMAFYNLTPGRQRGYIIYFSQPKQSQSKFNRIEKCRQKILNGEGLHDKYNC
jgi:uncharacterized protein YdeI (YjbR/CyaY-like superfamily)